MITKRSQVLGILIDSFPMEVPAKDIQKCLGIPMGTVSSILSELKKEWKVENNKAGWFLHNIHAKSFYVELAPGSTALITVNDLESDDSFVVELNDSDCILIEPCLDKLRLVYQN